MRNCECGSEDNGWFVETLYCFEFDDWMWEWMGYMYKKSDH